GVPANKRDMGMVFQAYSLFPNMTARDNVGYGLLMRRVATAERRRAADELLEQTRAEAERRRDEAQAALEAEIAPLESKRDATAAALEELQDSHQKSVIDLEQLQRDVTSVLDANRTPTSR
ncbi:MAG TPA: hypothetical protein VE395_12210, partial [Acidimicrobiales bacterium]|nr:hypothetical protein [Acidimicrobiales bacterium]